MIVSFHVWVLNISDAFDICSQINKRLAESRDVDRSFVVASAERLRALEKRLVPAGQLQNRRSNETYTLGDVAFC